MDEEKNSLKEAHGSGFMSTIIFMVVAIAVMVLLRNFLNYKKKSGGYFIDTAAFRKLFFQYRLNLFLFLYLQNLFP